MYYVDFFSLNLVLQFVFGVVDDFELGFDVGNFLPVKPDRILYFVDF